MANTEWVKPAVWGAIGGAIAAMIVGFVWGGWVTGGTANEMVSTGAEDAIVQAFTPLCVARAQEEPEQLALLMEASAYQHDDFVIEAGWVSNVNEDFQTGVARACALAIVEAMDVEAVETEPADAATD
jgi:predicted outer membrane lipoprotein